jgi:hypothetical protein
MAVEQGGDMNPLLLVKYWRVIALGAVVVAIGVTHFIAYRKGIEHERSRSIGNVVEIRKDLNEIRNLRPDDRALVDKLRRGEF